MGVTLRGTTCKCQPSARHDSPVFVRVRVADGGFAKMNPCHVRSGVAEAGEGVERKGRAADLFQGGRDETGQQGRDDLPTKQG